jgi:hypothetical protein
MAARITLRMASVQTKTKSPIMFMNPHSAIRHKTFLIVIFGFLSFASLAMPYLASANTIPIKSDVWNPTILSGPLLICTGVPGSGAINATCNNLCDLVAQIAQIIYFMIAVVIWIVTPITITVAGIRLMMSGANVAEPTKENPGERSKAKKMITGVVVGTVIVLCSWLMVKTVVTFFGISGVGGFSPNVSVCPLSS